MPSGGFGMWGQGQDPQATDRPLYVGPEPVFRNARDRLLAGYGQGSGQTPGSDYPDGYLGSAATSTRHADKLLNSGNYRNERPYKRGVHKGERLGAESYFWDETFNPMTGIQMQTLGIKFVSPIMGEPIRLTNDGKPGIRDTIIDPVRQQTLGKDLPPWR